MVVSIIVLLILSGISVSMLSGQNGILNRATIAKEQTDKAQEEEKKQLSNLEDLITETQTGVRARNLGRYVHYRIDITEDGKYDDDWRVFYEENGLTYLIASNYVPNKLIPEKTEINSTGLTRFSNKYSVYFEPESLTQTTINDSIISKYKLNWLLHKSIINKNAIATAHLLNPHAWSTFALTDIDERIEAVGAPTLELWKASWESKGYTQFYEKHNQDNGYNLNITEPVADDSYWANIQFLESGYPDDLYYPLTEEVDGCEGYWIASPCASYPVRVIFVRYSGVMSNNPYNSKKYGLRPIITMPSEIIGDNKNSGKSIYYINE